MKTDVIVVSSKGNQIEEALKLADKTAVFKELSPKGALQLRLLTEEMMSMVRALAGDVKGKVWIEDEDNLFQLNLQVEGEMSAKKRKQLISASSSGKNEASRGIMGKIRSFFEPEDDYPAFFDMSMVDDIGDVSRSLDWSLDAYRDQIQLYLEQEREGAKEAWDELEKSVISRVADDVKVSIRGREISMVIIKKLA